MSNLITPNFDKPNQSIRDWVVGHNYDAILINGFDHCIMGVTKQGRVIYDVKDILRTLVGMEHHWNYDDAIEWYEYNIQGSFSNKENDPIFVSTSFSYDFID